MFTRLKVAVMAGWLACLSGAAFAEAAPDFTLPTLDGAGQVTLSDYRGSVVYVDFWASWCGPCTVSLPEMDQVRRELGGLGFEVIAINLDEKPADAQRFLDKSPVSYPIVIDGPKQTPHAYKISGMPTAFLVDRKGEIRGVHSGFKKGDGERLKVAILDLLKEMP